MGHTPPFSRHDRLKPSHAQSALPRTTLRPCRCASCFPGYIAVQLSRGRRRAASHPPCSLCIPEPRNPAFEMFRPLASCCPSEPSACGPRGIAVVLVFQSYRIIHSLSSCIIIAILLLFFLLIAASAYHHDGSCRQFDLADGRDALRPLLR